MMKVIGCETAYSIVPVVLSDTTASGHLAVVEISDDLPFSALTSSPAPRNGSFLPHWYISPKDVISSGVAEVAPRLRSIMIPALLSYTCSRGLSVIQICQDHSIVPVPSFAAITALPFFPEALNIIFPSSNLTSLTRSPALGSTMLPKDSHSTSASRTFPTDSALFPLTAGKEYVPLADTT